MKLQYKESPDVRYDAPIYSRRSSGLLLIGICHSSFKKVGTKRIMDFKQMVKKLDHLAFESTAEVHEKRERMNTGLLRNYEGIAGSSFTGTKHFLDDCVTEDTHQRILHGMGISAQTFIAFRHWRAVKESMGEGTYENTLAMMKKRCEISREFGMLFLKQVEPADLLRLWLHVAEELIKRNIGDYSILDRCENVFISFLAAARDKHLYHPEIERICASFSGSKGAILGANHLDRLEMLLEGEGYDLDWKAFQEPLNQDMRKTIELIETMAPKFI